MEDTVEFCLTSRRRRGPWVLKRAPKEGLSYGHICHKICCQGDVMSRNLDKLFPAQTRYRSSCKKWPLLDSQTDSRGISSLISIRFYREGEYLAKRMLRIGPWQIVNLCQERDRTYLRFFSIETPFIEGNQWDMRFQAPCTIVKEGRVVNRLFMAFPSEAKAAVLAALSFSFELQ